MNHLVTLVPCGAVADKEVTLYVKGFLQPGESAEQFAPWLESHRTLTGSWGSAAAGWHWDCGDLRALPVPIAASAKLAWDAWRSTRVLRAPAIGPTLALAAVELGARLAVQYYNALSSASAAAAALAESLDGLAEGAQRVRVVAHSLGCRTVIEAAASLPCERRPHEIHLLAPACLESDVAPHLDALTRERAYVYYSSADLALGLGYRIFAQGSALGCVGPTRAYEGLEAIDVSEHFGLWVHAEYKRRFPYFVRGVRGPGERAVSAESRDSGSAPDRPS